MKYTHEVLDSNGILFYYWDEDSGDLYRLKSDERWLSNINEQNIKEASMTIRLVEEEN